MAKVKSSGLRNYVGRLGGAVYYVLRGQNIARELAAEVSNPRTPTQMLQRMKWANLVAMYKTSKGWMGRKSFENKKSNWSDYNAFMSANLGSASVYLTKQMVENGHCVLAPYTMTKGTLPAIGMEWNNDETLFISDLTINLGIASTTSIAMLSEALVDNNTDWAYGDQLSLIVMFNGRTYRPYLYAFEIILDNEDERTLAELLGDAVGEIFDSFNGYLAINPDEIYNPTQGLACACAFVHSRTTSGKTSVSTQALVLNGDGTTEYNSYRTTDAFENARESYGIGEEVFLDAGYLDGSSSSPIILNTITSFTGIWYTEQDIEVGFTITDGGTNTFRPSEQGASQEYTAISLTTELALNRDSDYCVAFIPTGETTPITSISDTPSGTSSINLRYPRSGATQIEDQAGTFYLVESDVYERSKVVARLSVTQ